ncbi:MAG: ABC transporter substrate-binding protein [Proteobacteria bacterium]|nr:ABC transporter substrate-binding protein [Pseudomonadota bacterium]
MKKTLIVAAAVALTASVAAAENVKVGVVLTYSGNGAEFGQQIDRGMEIFTKLHPDALGPNTVELIKRDSKTPDGAVAKTLVQELITRDHVQMVTGFVFSPDALASAPIVTQGKVPMIILNAGTAWITNQSPNIARVSFSMWHSGYPMGEYAATKLACKTAAVGYTDYPPGKDSLEAFSTGFKGKGGNVVDAIPMGGPAAVPDFTPFFQRVKDAKPDCFYVFVPAGNHAAAVIKTYDELGMRQAGVKLIGPIDIVQDTKLQAMGDRAVGLIVAGHYTADLNNPANKAFVAAWKQAYGADSTPDFMASAGYDGMAAIAHVVKTLNGKIDTDKAMAALKGWTFDGPRGRVMIDPNTRDIVQDIKIMRVVKMGNRIGTELIDTIPAVKDPCKALKVGKCGE